jgi:double zinc ribbon protein
MSDYSQKVSSSFNERMRLIRLRRKKENLRFWQEFKLVPRWLIWTVVVLYFLAQGIGQIVLHVQLASGESPWPELQGNPAAASLALIGIITGVSLCLAILIFMVGYVNQDAKRRGMNNTLWTLLVLILMPAWVFLGFIIYFLMREPMPYPCPQCGNSVGARFNFCPNCKCNLHPSCSNCKREIAETDKFCPYCGNDLAAGASIERVQQTPSPAS